MKHIQFPSTLIGLVVAGAVLAADGEPDTSYGTQGFAKISAIPLFDHEPSEMAKAVQGWGDRTYLIGSVIHGDEFEQQGLVIRVLPNGAVDEAFAGGAGMVAIGLGAESTFRPKDAVTTADGGLLVAGVGATPDRRPTVCKLTAAGELDETFDGGDGMPGCRTLNFMAVSDEGESSVVAVARANGDGYIVALTAVAGNWSYIAVTRLTATGQVDETFGDNGFTTITDSVPFRAHQLAVKPDGRIVVAGSVVQSPTDWDILMAQISADGMTEQLTSFAIDLTPSLMIDVPTALALRADGEIVVAGSATLGSSGFAAVLLRLDDTLLQIPPGEAQFPSAEPIDPERLAFMLCDSCTSKRVTDIAVLSDGGLLMVGDYYAGAGYEAFSLRLNANWELDTTFAAAGQAYPTFGASESDADHDVDPSIALQCGDRPVVAVLQVDAVTSLMATTRLLGGTIFCDDFEN